MVNISKWRLYFDLCKPRVVALMLLTAIIGMLLASPPGQLPVFPLIFGTLGIGLSAAAAAVINHLADQDIDQLMGRTAHRPLPTGQINTRQAFYFALIMGVSGLALLFIFINWLTAVLTLFTLIGYAGVYTYYLKYATPQNIVIGGLSGATPPLLGWTAVTNQIDTLPIILVLIIFMWTPPHFWALAIAKLNDYKKAKIPMLPVTHGVRYTKIMILLYVLLLTAVSLLPFVIGFSGIVYLIIAILLNAGFIFAAVKLFNTTDTKWPMITFRYSIVYLSLLFMGLLVDYYL